MKQLICFILALAMFCGTFIVTASAESLTEVHCDEEGFSLRIPSDKTAYWQEGVGFRVSVGEPGYVPYVAVSRRVGEERFKNPVNYLNNVYREYMEERYNKSKLLQESVMRQSIL